MAASTLLQPDQIDLTDNLNRSEPSSATAALPASSVSGNAGTPDQHATDILTHTSQPPVLCGVSTAMESSGVGVEINTAAFWSSTSPKQLMLMAIERLDVESATLRESNAHLLAEVVDLRRENAQLRRELDRAADDRRDIDERRIAIEHVNEKLTTELDEVRAVEFGAQEVERCRLKVTELGCRVEELQQQLASERTDRELIDRELAGHKKQQQLQCKSIKRNRWGSIDYVNGFSDDMAIDRDRRLEMALEIDALRSERDALRVTGDRMSTACGLLEAEVSRLRAAVEERDSELSRESVRHGLLTRQFNSLLNENERLKQRQRVQTSTTSSGLMSNSSSVSNIPGAISTTSGNSFAGGNSPNSRGFGSTTGSSSKASSDITRLRRSETWSSSLSFKQEAMFDVERETIAPSVSSHREPTTSSPVRHQPQFGIKTQKSELPSSQQKQSTTTSCAESEEQSSNPAETPLDFNYENRQQTTRRSFLIRRQQQLPSASLGRSQSHDGEACRIQSSVLPVKPTTDSVAAHPISNVGDAALAVNSSQKVPSTARTTNPLMVVAEPSRKRVDKPLQVPTMRLRTYGPLTMLAAVHPEEESTVATYKITSSNSSSSPTGSDVSTLPHINRRSTTMTIVAGVKKTTMKMDQTKISQHPISKSKRPPNS